MKYIRPIILLWLLQLGISEAGAQAPACIQQKIARPDSLLKAGIISVQSVVIGGHTLYYFEKPLPVQKGADRGSYITFYDTTCTPVTFFVGGIAGVIAPKGFTAKDYLTRKTTAWLWQATDARSVAAVEQPEKLNFFIKEQRYQVVRTDSAFPFRKDDVLLFSAAKGLYHYRAAKLVNRYKMIPEKAAETYADPCFVAPCPTSQRQIVALYTAPLGGYLKMNDKATRCFLMLCKTEVLKKTFLEKDWKNSIELRKL